MNDVLEKRDPTFSVNCSFAVYLQRRKAIDDKRMDGHGVPNYAFSLDHEARKKLDSIPGFYSTAKAITSTYVSQTISLMNRTALAVGPDQFPEIYAVAKDCARKLGIAVPNVFIDNDMSFNAYTIASDDIEPVIVIHNGLRNLLTLSELKFIIGHECGHIHNYHTAYEYVSQLILSAGVGVTSGVNAMLATILSLGSTAALSAWSRAAEVSADRAGMICADSVEDSYSAIAKCLYGGTIGKTDSVNIGPIMEQLKYTTSNITKYDELFSDHPSSARRLKAMQEFSECAVYYEWRPDLKKPGQIQRSKKETDMRCKQYIDLSAKG